MFLTLNLMRDLRLHLIEYKYSANLLNSIELGCCFSVTALNLVISAFDPGLGQIAFQKQDL